MSSGREAGDALTELPTAQARSGFIALKSPLCRESKEMSSPPSQGSANDDREPAGW